MVRRGTEIEHRTGVRSTFLIGVFVGKFTGGADKKSALQTGRYHVRGSRKHRLKKYR